jgi:hypothetical protein
VTVKRGVGRKEEEETKQSWKEEVTEGLGSRICLGSGSLSSKEEVTEGLGSRVCLGS